MNKPLFLVAVQRQVGGIQIEHEAGRRRGVGFEEKIDQESIDGRRIDCEFAVAVCLPGAQFQTVQGAFSCGGSP